MSARFWASGLQVYDRKDGSTVCMGCRSRGWAEMIADGLNLIVDRVAPWSPGAVHTDVFDGEVIDDPVTLNGRPAIARATYADMLDGEVIDVTYGGKALVLGDGDTIEHGTRRVELS